MEVKYYGLQRETAIFLLGNLGLMSGNKCSRCENIACKSFSTICSLQPLGNISPINLVRHVA